jgi:hypothetical protein
MRLRSGIRDRRVRGASHPVIEITGVRQFTIREIPEPTE